MAKRLRILHLSDLHIGKERPEDGWRVERVMGEAWARNLREIADEGAIDLVCFTGDLAQKGRPDEYAGVREVIDAVLQSVGCSHERFFCVPGNHDIDRDIAPDAWKKLRELQWHDPQGLSRWMAGGKPPFGCEPEWRDGIVGRQQAYRDFLTDAGLPHLLPEHNPHGRFGYRRTLDLDLGAPLHIIGFDSAWLAGDDNDAGKLRLTDDQIGRLLTGADGKALSGWSIGLIHHPLTDLADAHDAQRLLGHFGLGLLLHGHQHDPLIEHWADPQTALHIFAAGCLYEHQRYPNGLLVVDVDLPEAQPLRPKQVWARKWSHRRSEWIDDDDLYRGTRNGRLKLTPDDPVPFTPTPGKFVGRTHELDQLRAALLPAARGAGTQPTVICCAIDGMPGVGKTRLAEEFVAHEWRAALRLPEDTPLQDLRAHLALTPADHRDAEALAAAVLAAYGRNARVGEAQAALRQMLCSGPGGRRLLLIENVDDRPQAEAVAKLVAQLPGCAVLCTARYRDLAGASWARVPVAPLPLDNAVELLRSRIAAGRKPYPLDDAQAAEALVERLGRLPLALHIAGSHVGRGSSPKRFLEQLEAKRLGLGPAAAGDAVVGAEEARALISGAFAISWDAWCGGAGTSTVWQTALVALAHGPADGVGDALGAAIAALDAADYEHCTLEADSLSLLEIEFIEQDGVATRRTRLHPLIAEFLRDQSVPDEAMVMLRIGDWCGVHLQESNAQAVPAAWAALRAETPALLHWLARAQQPPAAAVIGYGAMYALGNGPYTDWLAAYARWGKTVEDPGLFGDLCLAEARLSEQAGDPVRSEAAARAALAAFRDAGMELDIAITHGHIADLLQARGEWEGALRILREDKLPIVARLGDMASYAVTQGQIADILQSRGELEKALQIRRRLLPMFEQLGSARERALTQGKIADILQLRGELDQALRIYREDVAPVFERLGDVRMRTIVQSRIADLLQARGELGEALRIWREEQLPVYERLGDVRSFAMTHGKIADILQANGHLEEALRIRREQELPVYERLGDVRAHAVTQGKIACILFARGELGEALLIQREQELPVYERLGDVRLLSLGRTNLAITLIKRGWPEDRPEIRNLLQQALADAERLRLPEADAIRGLITQIFGDGDDSASHL